MTHQCIKCKAQYQDNEEDAYLCAQCLVNKKVIAEQIDAQFASRPRVVAQSDFSRFDELSKQSGLNHDGVRFVKYNML